MVQCSRIHWVQNRGVEICTAKIKGNMDFSLTREREGWTSSQKSKMRQSSALCERDDIFLFSDSAI